LLQNYFFKIKFKISKYRLNKNINIQEKGYDSFLNGMIAIANKDYKKAIIESKKTSNYLKYKPGLSLLLESEVYKVEKKYEQLSLVFEKMSKNKQTENLAYRGLMEQYLRSQDYHHAFIYGEKLFNNNPFVEKIYETLVNIIAKTNNWQQLLNISDKAYAKKIIDKKTYQINKSIAYFEIAKIKQFSDSKEALNNIKIALSFRKYFSPYVKLYLEILLENKNFNDAKKYLRKIWGESPNSKYFQSIINTSKSLKSNILELTKYVISNDKSEESKILLTKAFIVEKKWEEARNEIKTLLDAQPTKQACLLMAEIEKGDNNDIQKFNSWMLRAKNGAEDKMWICVISKQTQDDWSALSYGGFFNSLEWTRPPMISQSFVKNESLIYENR
jgi:HemY protein